MARGSLSLLFVLLFARPSCLSIPQFPEPRAAGPLVAGLVPDPYHVWPVTSTAGYGSFTVEFDVYSEDLTTEEAGNESLDAEAWVDHPSNLSITRWSFGGSHLTVTASGGLSSHRTGNTIQIPASLVRPGCHQVTVVVQQRSTRNTATATWWIDFDDTGRDAKVVDCPGVGLLGRDGGAASRR